MVRNIGYYLFILHTLASLKTDTDYKTAQRSAFEGKMLDCPELSGAAGYYDGFAIFEDIVGIRAWGGGTFFGGSFATATQPTATTTNTNMIVFGNSAIGKGIGKSLSFSAEVTDHGNHTEIGAAEISGYNRADFGAEDDAGEVSGDLFYKGGTGGVAGTLTAKNTSSLIIMTDEN